MLLGANSGQPDAVGRIATQTTVADGVLHDHREDAMVRADCSGADSAVLVRDPRLDVGVRDRVQRRRAPARLQTSPRDGDVPLQRAGLDLHERVDPLLAPGREGDAGAGRGHIVTASLRHLEGGEVQIGFAFGPESSLVGLLASGSPIADSVAPPCSCVVCADASHRPHPVLSIQPRTDTGSARSGLRTMPLTTSCDSAVALARKPRPCQESHSSSSAPMAEDGALSDRGCLGRGGIVATVSLTLARGRRR